MGICVLLTGGQMLFGREHFWLPHWLIQRTIAREKICKALGLLRRPARFVDRLIRPRVTNLIQGAGAYVIAVLCIAIGGALPAMELVPFATNGAGAALTAYGLALVARDGLVALIALAFTATTIGFVVYNLV